MTDEERKRLRAVCDRLSKLTFEVGHAISEFEALAYPELEAEPAINEDVLRHQAALGVPWKEPRRRASVIAEALAPDELREQAQANDANENTATDDGWASGGGSADFGQALRLSDDAVYTVWRTDEPRES